MTSDDRGVSRLDLVAPLLPDWFIPMAPLDDATTSRLAAALGAVASIRAAEASARISKEAARGRLDGTVAFKALTLDDDAWRAWRAERKTRFEVEGRTAYLTHVHARGASPEVSLEALRSRIRTLRERGAISAQDLEAALTLPLALWQGTVGAGRSRAFVYDGADHPELVGTEFRSIAWFIHVIGKSDMKATIWARLKAGWELDDAVREPVLEGRGCVYRLTCAAIGKSYVGLTAVTPERRFDQHCRTAGRGSNTPLHQAIRQHGGAAFHIETIEVVADEKKLCEREIYWIAELGTLAPSGLNVLPGGQVGRYRGVATQYADRTFRSREDAVRAAVLERDVAEHVARRYIALGQPIPETPRKVVDHPDAAGASPFNDLWRIHKSLLNRIDRGKARYALDPTWRDYDTFKRDVAASRAPGLRLMHADVDRPLGPENFVWVTRQDIVDRSHGTAVTLNGVAHANAAAAAASVGIAASTFRFRLDSGMTADEAAALGPGGVTSAKPFLFEGVTYPSLTAAAAFAAAKYEVSRDVARDRLRRGRPFGEPSSGVA